MKLRIQFSLMVLLCLPSLIFGQISYEIPAKSESIRLNNKFEKVIMPSLNMPLILAENEQRIANGQLPEIGKLIEADLHIRTHGNWTNLPNGDRVWRLGIESDGAQAISLYYSKFRLPGNSTLHIYNYEKTEVLGAFSSHNNIKNEEFATGIVRGDKVVLEYYEPASVRNQGVIAISHVGHAFRDIPSLNPEKGFGDSDPCEVNVNCSEGNNWQDQKRGVNRILLKIGNGFFWCSGSLINNTDQDCTPYVLSAWHCGIGASTADINQWIFYFNYEAPNCPNPGSAPGINSITGATMRSNSNDGGGNTGSDFMLVELNSAVPDSYNPYYNGWSRLNVSSPSGVGIHHPAGDIKKISTYTSALTSTTWGGTPNTHWRVVWVSTANGHGVTEGGSSGSPIFNSDGLIVGDLTGGASFCTSPNAPDRYGKFSYSWASNGNTAAERLSDWLDPGGTGATTLPGTNQPCSTTCANGMMDGDETGVDCGGSCPPCPTCDDGMMNGDETGVDCGGPDCLACPPEYCDSAGDDTSFEWIETVQFGSINNNSGDNGGYADFTAQGTVVSPGQSYAITLTPGFDDQTYDEYWRVWIDFNIDEDFDDANELVFEDNGNAAVSGTITIPVGATTGTTRMRVSMKYDENPTQCEEFQYGEVEDYSIVIQPSCALTASATPTSGVTCNGDSDGSALAFGSSGIPPFSYNWDNGETTFNAIMLNGGTHAVTVTDLLGCTATASVAIAEPSAISAIGSTTNESFPGAGDGSIDILPSGGSAGFSYLWSNGATAQDVDDLLADTYNVTITDSNGCTGSGGWVVSSNTNLTVVCTTVFLEGSFNQFTLGPNDRMRTTLRDNNILPLAQPFNVSPWNYGGSESFSSLAEMPSDMVDWVYVVLRAGNDPSNVSATFAGVLHADGSITDTEGNFVAFDISNPAGYYIEVFHLGHLPVVSAIPVVPDGSGFLCYDFTTNMNQSYRNPGLDDDPVIELNSLSGFFSCMIGGNCQPLDCQVDANDATSMFQVFNANPYYGPEDTNMDGLIDSNDLNGIFNAYNSNCHRPY
ncbi:MAG: GEVED domain-containing protein [Bacteroidota bacterium]